VNPSSIAGARRGAVTSLAVAALCALVPLASLGKSLWRDEAATLYSAHLSWSALWQQSRVVDRVLLPYYVLVHVWIFVSPRIEWVRALSLLAFVATVFLVGQLGRRLGGAVAGISAGLIVGTNPLMLQSALDARPYALATLTATLAIWAAWSGLNDPDHPRWWWCCALTVITAGLQLFIALAPFAVLATVVIRVPSMTSAQIRRFVIPSAVLVVATTTWIDLVVGQGGQVSWIPRQTSQQAVKNLAGSAFFGHHTTYLAVTAIALLAAIVRLSMGTHLHTTFSGQQGRTGVVLLAWTFLPGAALVALSFFHPAFVDRYVTASVPGLALLCGWLISLALSSSPTASPPAPLVRYSSIAAGVLSAVLLLAQSTTTTGAVIEDLSGGAHYLTRVATSSSDMVVLPDHALTEGITYYTDLAHARLTLWPQRRDQTAVEGLDVLTTTESFVNGAPTVYVVQDQSVRLLAAFESELVRHHYVLRSIRTFPGAPPLLILHFVRVVSSH